MLQCLFSYINLLEAHDPLRGGEQRFAVQESDTTMLNRIPTAGNKKKSGLLMKI